MTLFNDTTSTAADPVVDETKDYLSELVGEGKKFADPQALARGKAEADAFIERLKAEQAGLREELNQRARLADLVDKLNPQNQTQNPNREPDTPAEPDGKTEAFDPNKLNEIVSNLLNERESKSQAEKNVAEVKKALIAKFGTSFGEKLKAQAQTLGVSPEWMTKVAEQSPNAFFNLIGLNSQQSQAPGFTPPDNERRTAFEPANPNRNKSYYDKIKKTDPTKYWSPATQTQMHKDAIAQGEKFFS